MCIVAGIMIRFWLRSSILRFPQCMRMPETSAWRRHLAGQDQKLRGESEKAMGDASRRKRPERSSAEVQVGDGPSYPRRCNDGCQYGRQKQGYCEQKGHRWREGRRQTCS
eukprot:2157354-Rhodomonas_salina.3